MNLEKLKTEMLPWPESVWPDVTKEEYETALPEGNMRSRISAHNMRQGWLLALKAVEEQMADDAEEEPASLEPDETREHSPGDIFQILETYDDSMWVGAFLQATEIKEWGVMGFVHVLKTPPGFAYVRIEWEHLSFIGKAVMISQ